MIYHRHACPVQCHSYVHNTLYQEEARYIYAVPPEEAYTWGGLLIFIKLGVLFNDDKFIMEITVN